MKPKAYHLVVSLGGGGESLLLDLKVEKQMSFITRVLGMVP